MCMAYINGGEKCLRLHTKLLAVREDCIVKLGDAGALFEEVLDEGGYLMILL